MTELPDCPLDVGCSVGHELFLLLNALWSDMSQTKNSTYDLSKLFTKMVSDVGRSYYHTDVCSGAQMNLKKTRF